ncbi:MAG: pectate lyase [Bacteroidota bacterium]
MAVVSGCSGGLDTGGIDPGGGGGAMTAGTGGASGSGGVAPGSGGATQASGGAPVGGAGTAGRASGGAASAGRAGTGGMPAVGGGAATGGGGAGGGGTPANLCQWPTPVGPDEMVSKTIAVSGMYDGGMKRFVGAGALGSSGQTEDQGPLFDVANGGTLQNVILGNPAADGVHCAGTCTLKNVWWEDVGEDAATLKGALATQTMTIDGGGANHASDKVFQHNGPGTMVIKNFCAQDFGKLYRSCGNCTTQYARHVQLENVRIIPGSGTSALVGVNTNYNDTATFKAIAIQARANALTICQRYTGNDTGAEPPKNGAGADGTVCVYAPTDITWQ